LATPCPTALARSAARCAVVVLMALAGACRSYVPAPLEPSAELEALTRRLALPPGSSTTDRAPSDWFPIATEIALDDGLDLAEANALALVCAPQLRTARDAARISGAQLLGAGVPANPELVLGPRVTTQRPDLIFPAGLAFEIPLDGRRARERDAADARATAAVARVQDAELTTLAELRASFVELAFSARERALRSALVAAIDPVTTWIDRLHAAGECDDVTAYLVHLERDDAEARLAELDASVGAARRAVLAQLGLLPDAPVAIRLDLDPLAMPELAPSPSEAIIRLPRLRAAEADYAAAEAELARQVARQIPALRFGPEYESDRGEQSLGLGLSLALPIFDRNRGPIAVAEAEREAARNRYQDALLAARHAEAGARAEWQSAATRLRQWRTGALRDAGNAERALEQRLRSGHVEVLEVVAVLRAIGNARGRELELDRSSTLARLRAAVAAGAVLYGNEP
jgi:cobalt-zinc-cadmium efflux system outer membrane protein